jgi:hypothetical protein
MGFWSGFEGLTGHRPGAFKGFRLKDIIDKDLWERKQRTWSGKMLPQGATEAERQRDLRFSRGGEPMMTNWYKGRGAAGVTPVDPASRVPFTRRRGGFTGPTPTREYPIVPSDRIPHDYARTSPARPWPNIQAQMLRGQRQGVESMRIPSAELTADKTTVKKVFADPNKSDEIIETIKEKVPIGNMRIPTSELMGARSLAPRRQSTSIMDMMIPIGELMEMRRRRDQMRFRQNPYHMLRRSY